MPKYDNFLLGSWLTDRTYYPPLPASGLTHRIPGWTSINWHIARVLTAERAFSFPLPTQMEEFSLLAPPHLRAAVDFPTRSCATGRNTRRALRTNTQQTAQRHYSFETVAHRVLPNCATVCWITISGAIQDKYRFLPVRVILEKGGDPPRIIRKEPFAP